MARVFISHSSRDNEDAERIKVWLTQEGFDAPFLDFDKHVGIPPGANWEQTLYREIDQSDAVIIVQTPNWLDSKWCFAEFTQARALGKPIFPVIQTPTGQTLIAPDIQALDLTTDAEGGFARLARALSEIALDAQSGFQWDRTRPPYPGLMAFQQDDAAIYFGRDDDIRRLSERLNARRTQGGAKIIALLGASGSGKSSLMRAGLIPRLRRAGRNWIVLPPMRPQTRPLDELARTLALASDRGPEWQAFRETLRAPDLVGSLRDMASDLRMHAGANEAQILLPVDQAEELFGASDPDQAAEFMAVLNALEALPDTPITALLAMRSDYLGALQAAPDLTARFEEFSLGPLPLARIPQIIEGPARVAGLGIDDALVHRAAADAETEDALPLLAFALRELYDRASDDNYLSLDEYAALGDPRLGLTPLENAVRRAADDVLREAAPSDADLAALEEAFIPAMVRINDSGEYVRQPARWDELPVRAHPLLERLAAARLLVIRQEEDGKTVEVSHEALLRKWPRLRGWLDDAREFLAGRQQLQIDRADWANAAEADKAGALLTGLKLGRARAWLTDRPTQLSAEDRAFIQASIDRAEAEEARKTRNRKRLTTVSLAVAVVMAGLAAVAGFQWLDAKRTAEERLAEQIDMIWTDLATRSASDLRMREMYAMVASQLRRPEVPAQIAMNTNIGLWNLMFEPNQTNTDGFDCRTTRTTGFRALYCSMRNVVGLEKLESLSGQKAFLPDGPHGAEINFDAAGTFGHYDPEFLDWLDERLVPDGPDDPRVNAFSRLAYDVRIGPLVRALYRSHVILHAEPEQWAAFSAVFDSYGEEWREARSQDRFPDFAWNDEIMLDFDAVRMEYEDQMPNGVETEFFEKRFWWMSEFLAAHRDDDLFLVNTAAGFWVRRHLDKTDARIFELVVDMLEAFEPAVLEDNLLQRL